MAVVAALVMLVTSSGTAQTASRPQPAVARATAGALTGSSATTGVVIGTAWRGDTQPYPQARIRLRNVETGRGVARTLADGDGRFWFERAEPGAYVVELLSSDDKVLAVGDSSGSRLAARRRPSCD